MIFYGNNDKLFYAKFDYDFPRTVGINNDDLHGQFHGEPIPLHYVYPLFSNEIFISTPEPLPPNTFVKQPSLLRYKDEESEEYNTITELYRNEALFCEVLKRNPHPNLATYFGCRVRNGRITGLCFKKYEDELGVLIESCPSRIDKKKCSEGVRRGIEHMHSLGYVHNDINPRNIMINTEGNPIIIDFDSCRQIAEWVGPKFGTSGFCAVYSEQSFVLRRMITTRWGN